MSLQRFHEAQASPHAGYETALAEIRRGRKTSHWIWYILPQLAGLGHCQMTKRCAILDFAEACEYLRDPFLRARYREIIAAVSDNSRAAVSSLTLFGAAAHSRTCLNDSQRIDDPKLQDLGRKRSKAAPTTHSQPNQSPNRV
ncbi:MAG: DUF1810 domain-containing protein [Verrucomicrobiota bacterium]|nr:DUF1810 domain-containing protein [Verrucomicrobiota bacterium]